MLTHLRRELAHAVWMLLMDDDFMHAYIHGLLFRLVDGILRIFFPRFLTYSADYPEKCVAILFIMVMLTVICVSGC